MSGNGPWPTSPMGRETYGRFGNGASSTRHFNGTRLLCLVRDIASVTLLLFILSLLHVKL